LVPHREPRLLEWITELAPGVDAALSGGAVAICVRLRCLPRRRMIRLNATTLSGDWIGRRRPKTVNPVDVSFGCRNFSNTTVCRNVRWFDFNVVQLVTRNECLDLNKGGGKIGPLDRDQTSGDTIREGNHQYRRQKLIERQRMNRIWNWIRHQPSPNIPVCGFSGGGGGGGVAGVDSVWNWGLLLLARISATSSRSRSLTSRLGGGVPFHRRGQGVFFTSR